MSAFVAKVNGRALSCAMVMSTGRVARVYWVATRPDARNHGYGELVTRAATRAGFEHGASVVVLQATTPGVPLCRKIGFASFTSYRRYLRSPQAPRATTVALVIAEGAGAGLGSSRRAAVRPRESDFDEWIYLGAAPIKAVRVSAPT